MRRGPFERTVLVTGEIEAAEAATLSVPPSPSWRVELRWLAEDGSVVQAGERLAEVDNSEFVRDLETKEIGLQESLSELERRQAEALGEIRRREMAVVRARAELDKARIESDLPEEIVPRQELADRRLKLAKARSALETAEAELASQSASSEAELGIQRIEIEKARRQIAEARRAIESSVLRAPRDGLFLVAEQPWEDRKLQEGDTVWVGMPVGSIPDLRRLRVEARLSDVDDGRVEVGMAARVVLDAYPDRIFRGEVTRVGKVAQEEGRQSLRRFFQVDVRLDETDPERMIPGMSARVEVIAEERGDVLLVSRRAVDFGEDGAPRVHRRRGGPTPVRLGPCNTLECVVEEGLREGDEVALAAGADRPGREAGS